MIHLKKEKRTSYENSSPFFMCSPSLTSTQHTGKNDNITRHHTPISSFPRHQPCPWLFFIPRYHVSRIVERVTTRGTRVG